VPAKAALFTVVPAKAGIQWKTVQILRLFTVVCECFYGDGSLRLIRLQNTHQTTSLMTTQKKEASF
jgi:hypothetical protein